MGRSRVLALALAGFLGATSAHLDAADPPQEPLTADCRFLCEVVFGAAIGIATGLGVALRAATPRSRCSRSWCPAAWASRWRSASPSARLRSSPVGCPAPTRVSGGATNA